MLVRLQGESSNSLFEELADWNGQLRHCDYYKDSDELPDDSLEERRPQRPSNSPKGGLS